MIDLNKLHAFDTETFKIEPGNRTPKLVCASIADATSARVVFRHEARSEFLKCLDDGGVIGGAHIAYDFGVMSAEFPDLIPHIFRALEEDRVIDTHLLEALHDVATGNLYKDPLTGAPFGRYSLSMLEERHLGKNRDADKYGENAWRLRYHELYDVPPEQWPEDALKYAKDDARGTYDVLVRQLQPDRLNVSMIHQEMRAEWSLSLMSIWGIRTDPRMVEKVCGDIEREHFEYRARFLKEGLVKRRKPRGGKDPETADGTDFNGKPFMYQADTKAIKARVWTAYQGNPPLTEKGATSISRDTLINSGDSLLEEYGKSGVIEKEFSTYIDVLRQGSQVPINTEYKTILASDRTSSSKPNLQNISR